MRVTLLRPGRKLLADGMVSSGYPNHERLPACTRSTCGRRTRCLLAKIDASGFSFTKSKESAAKVAEGCSYIQGPLEWQFIADLIDSLFYVPNREP